MCRWSFIDSFVQVRLSSDPAIIKSPVIEVVPFLLCLSCWISDEFDSYAPCLASLVLVYANPGCDKTISLVSSVAILCFLFSILLFDSVFCYTRNYFVFFCIISFNCCISYVEIADIIFFQEVCVFLHHYYFLSMGWEGRGWVFGCFIWRFVPLVVINNY